MEFARHRQGGKRQLMRRFAGLFLFCAPFAVYSYLFSCPFGNDFNAQRLYLVRFLYYLRLGFFPLWSPMNYGGMPMAYESATSGVLSPLNWIYCLFPAVFEGRLAELGVLMISVKLVLLGTAGIFAFLFFRRITHSGYGSVLGALTFIFNGRVLDDFRYSTPLDVDCFLPVLAFLAEKYAAKKKGEKASALWCVPLLVGVMLLSGRPQHGLFNLLFLAAYFIFRAWSTAGGEALRRIAVYLLCLVWGVLIACPLLLPFGHDAGGGLAVRIGGQASYTDAYRMTLNSLGMNLGFPWLADVHSAFYPSVAGWLLFLAALVILAFRTRSFGSEKSLAFFFAAAFAACLAYSFGSRGGLWTVVSWAVPPLAFSRAHGRVMIIGIFCFAALVSLGMRVLGGAQPADRRLFLRFLAGAAVFYATLCLALFAYEAATHFDLVSKYAPVRIQERLSLANLQLGSFLFFTAAAAAGRVVGCASTGRRRRIFQLLLVLLILSEARFYHERGTWYAGASGGWPNIHRKIFDVHDFARLDTLRHRVVCLGPSGTQSPLVDKSIELSGVAPDAPRRLTDFLLAGKTNASLLYALGATPKIYFNPDFKVVANVFAALEQLSVSPANIGLVTLVDKRDAQGLERMGAMAGSGKGLKAGARIRIESFTPNLVELDVAAPESGFVNYLDNFSAGWKAAVDGVPQDVTCVYGAFKGVWVPSGRHRVLMRYDPPSCRMGFRLGLWFFGIWCIWVGGLGIWPHLGSLRGVWKPVFCMPIALAVVWCCLAAEKTIYAHAFRPGYVNYYQP